jgi:hypothetical protein
LGVGGVVYFTCTKEGVRTLLACGRQLLTCTAVHVLCGTATARTRPKPSILNPKT